MHVGLAQFMNRKDPPFDLCSANALESRHRDHRLASSVRLCFVRLYDRDRPGQAGCTLRVDPDAHVESVTATARTG
jgi:hypothetical protein